MNQQFIDRINELPDVFMLASLVQFKYVQTFGEPNDTNFNEVAMIDCNKCEKQRKNKRTKPRIFCESCVHSGNTWKKPLFVQKTHLERTHASLLMFYACVIMQFKYVQTISNPEPNDKDLL